VARVTAGEQANPCSRGVGAQQGGNPRGAVLRRQVKADAAVDLQPEGDLRRGQREAADNGLGVVGLGAGVLEELAPCRRGKKQVADDDPGAGWAAGGSYIRDAPALDADRLRAVGIGRAGGDGEPGGGADRGQRLAAETECVDVDQVVVGQLGGCVALHGKRQFGAGHAMAVIADLDAVDAAAFQRDGDPGGARIECVLDQLLHRGGGAFDHLAGGDAVHRGLGEDANGGHDTAAWLSESSENIP